MAKRGPVPNYKPDFCPIAYKFCLLGATNEDLADLFEVSLATIGNWLAKYPDFKKAVQEGRDVADADVAHSLHQQAKSFTHPDVKTCRSRARRRKSPTTGISRPTGRPPSSGCATAAASNGAR